MSESKERSLSELSKCLSQASHICSEIAKKEQHPENEASMSQNLNCFGGEVSDIVNRARTMISYSSRGGRFQRLSNKERLRSTSNGYPHSRPTSSKKAKKESEEPHAFEFVLLHELFDGGEYEENYPAVFSEDNVLLRGIVQFMKTDNENDMRKQIANVIKKKFSLVSPNDFEFLKVNRRKVTLPLTSSEWNFKSIKLLAGQGAIYVKLKREYEFIINENDDTNEEESTTTMPIPTTTAAPNAVHVNISDASLSPNSPTIYSSLSLPANLTGVPNPPIISTALSLQTPSPVSSFPPDTESTNPLEQAIAKVLNMTHDIQNPVSILKYAQDEIVTGRPLELSEESVVFENTEGNTSFLSINRECLLDSAMEEVPDIVDLRKTVEVGYYGEFAKDFGGPRKEFFRQVLQDIEDKYFVEGNAAADFSAESMKTVGTIFSLSILQNGPFPRFLNEATLQSLFAQPAASSLLPLSEGMDKLGIIRIGVRFPVFLNLFRRNDSFRLSRKKIIDLLKPQFSEKGTNRHSKELKIYSFFNKYCREVASGRVNGMSLEKILRFVTGCEEEPVLGFRIPPKIIFAERDNTDSAMNFVPTSNTCTNTLVLYFLSESYEIPNDERLFEVYSMAFLNDYFGLV